MAAKKAEADKPVDLAAYLSKKVKGSVELLDDMDDIPGVIPSGSLWFDLATGVGGWPLARFCLIAGNEGTGKTTALLSAGRECQAMGGEFVYIDAERKLNKHFAMRIVDPRKTVIRKPDSLDECFDLVEIICQRSIDTGLPTLAVIDSLNAVDTLTNMKLRKAGKKPQPGNCALLATDRMRELVPIIEASNTCCVLISHIKHKIGVVYGSDKTTACGKAPTYYSAFVAHLRPAGKIKKGSRVVGVNVDVDVKKNQVSVMTEQISCELHIRFDQGIDKYMAAVEAGVEVDVVEKAGSWFEIEGLGKWQGNTGLRGRKRRDEILAHIATEIIEQNGWTHRK